MLSPERKPRARLANRPQLLMRRQRRPPRPPGSRPRFHASGGQRPRPHHHLSRGTWFLPLDRRPSYEGSPTTAPAARAPDPPAAAHCPTPPAGPAVLDSTSDYVPPLKPCSLLPTFPRALGNFYLSRSHLRVRRSVHPDALRPSSHGPHHPAGCPNLGLLAAGFGRLASGLAILRRLIPLLHRLAGPRLPLPRPRVLLRRRIGPAPCVLLRRPALTSLPRVTAR
jgi:hypothetical protein